jgi:hypothetical protein
MCTKLEVLLVYITSVHLVVLWMNLLKMETHTKNIIIYFIKNVFGRTIVSYEAEKGIAI